MQGIDVSQVMVNLAEKEIEKRALKNKIKVHTGKATDLPHPDETFDIFLSTYVIKHLSDKLLLKMMQEVKRVLKIGGRFCLWEVGHSVLNGRTNFYKRLLSLEVSTINLRLSDEIRRMMEETRFGDIKPFGHGFYFFCPFIPRVGFIGMKT
jgi:ubiquinone/menaquinone biosynthesis C-methylase UbiE